MDLNLKYKQIVLIAVIKVHQVGETSGFRILICRNKQEYILKMLRKRDAL